MREERRNLTRRAETFRQLVAMLLARGNASISGERVAAVADISTAAAGRILRRLALKMLVRSEGHGRWTATAVLWSGKDLQLQSCSCDGLGQAAGSMKFEGGPAQPTNLRGRFGVMPQQPVVKVCNR